MLAPVMMGQFHRLQPEGNSRARNITQRALGREGGGSLWKERERERERVRERERLEGGSCILQMVWTLGNFYIQSSPMRE